MEIKDKVKQRREERIRILRETGGPASVQDEPGLVYSAEQAHYIHDPEYAWKQKFKQDSTRIADQLKDGPDKSLFSPPAGSSFFIKLVVSAALFGAVWMMFNVQQPWALKGRVYVNAALTQSFDFQAAAAWYERQFGDSPAFIPSFRNKEGEDAMKVSTTKRTYFVPVPGKIVSSFDQQHPRVTIKTASEAPVYALDTGQVIFAGVKEGLGNSVIIRHPGGIESTYGSLSSLNVEMNDWIKGGEPIGKAMKGAGSEGSILFGVTKDGLAVNPTDVVAID